MAIWLLCVSKPPREQKKTWRFRLSAERTARSCATCFSWFAQSTGGGEHRVRAAVAEASAAERILLSAKELEVIELAD